MKKTTTALIFSLLLISFFAGCISPQDQTTTDDTTTDTEDTTTDTEDTTTDTSDIKTNEVESGDTVSVDYKGSFENGTVFDTSIKTVAQEANLQLRPEYSPLQFTVGGGQMIKGFDNAVLGMKIGETKTVSIPPEDAYGLMDPLAIQTTPLMDYANLEELETGYGQEIAEGDVLESPFGSISIIEINDSNVTLELVPTEIGTLVPSPYGLMKIDDVNSTHMTINLNALLGETLVFEMTVTDIQKSIDE